MSVGADDRETPCAPAYLKRENRHGLYYFDLRDAGYLSVDEDGMELPTMQSVQIEAARSLVDLAKDAVWTTAATALGHQMAIEVRDENGPVLQAKFTFAIERHKH